MVSKPAASLPASGDRKGRLQTITHDARHSLYAVRLGARLICDARTESREFSSLAEMVRRESRRLVECVEELIQMAR
jgi:signal transduction histidine kinase